MKTNSLRFIRAGLILLVAIFIAFVSASFKSDKVRAATQSPHWPSALAAGILFGLDGQDWNSIKKPAYDFAVTHLDYIASIDGHYLDYMWAINPTMKLGFYDQFVSALKPSTQQAVIDRANELGIDVEDAYLHYNQDKYPHTLRANYDVSVYYPWLTTEYDSAAGNWKVNVPGWDPANDKNGDGYVDDTEYANLVNPNAHARRRIEARTCGWSWGKVSGGQQIEYPQWGIYPGQFEVAKVLVDIVQTKIDQPVGEWGQSRTFDLIMWDAIGGWLWTNDLNEYAKDLPGREAYRQDIANLTAYSKEKFGNQILIGGNSNKGYWVIDQHLDVVIREGLINSWDNASNWEGPLPGELYGVFNPNSSYYKSRQAGKVQLIQHMYKLCYYIGGSNAYDCLNNPQSYPDIWARDRIFGAAFYYVLQNPGKDYWNADSTGTYYWPILARQEKEWPKALEVDIGQPTNQAPGGATLPGNNYWGAWVFAEGADPGHPDYPDITKSRYKIYAREYSKGLVLLKPKSGNDSSRSTFLDNTATTHTLPGTYFKVKDDGTIDSTPITSITLRNGEAVILVEEGVGLSKQVDKTSAASGETLTYTINYSNNTAGEVTNAKIEDPIPLGTTFISADGGGTSDGTKVIWNLGTIAAGANGTVTFQVRIE